MTRTQHPDGCQCDRDACHQARQVRPRDEREARQWYFADLSDGRWGPTLAEREQARRATPAEVASWARRVVAAQRDREWQATLAALTARRSEPRSASLPLDRLDRPEMVAYRRSHNLTRAEHADLLGRYAGLRMG